MMIGNRYEGFSLYLHVPFCLKKCGYCHFYVVKSRDDHIESYITSLKQEIDLVLPSWKGKRLTSLYLGGGTPSLLSFLQWEEIFSYLRRYVDFDANTTEITLEMNPETKNSWDFHDMIRLGINRLSLGVQSFSPRLLSLLEREHSFEDIQDVCLRAVSAGLTNISCDLMYEVPDQTVEDWFETLRILDTLPFTHLSLYNLVIEPYTAFNKRKKELQKRICSDEEGRVMYWEGKKRLEASGWSQYEISAFAKNGAFSLHNTGYWHGRSFLGLGPSAFSYLHPKRFQNTPHISKWKQQLAAKIIPIHFEETLPQERKLRELLVVALRVLEGVCLDLFQQQFGRLNSEDFVELRSLEAKGLLSFNNGIVQLSQEGILHYDYLAGCLI